LADRRSTRLLDDIGTLRAAFRQVRAEYPFTIEAIVILPDHLHAVWTLPLCDADYGLRWRLIKTLFSRRQPQGERRSASRLVKQERGIWQRRFWEHRIRDENDYASHVDYVHINPVKHGWVRRVGDWPWSSFHSYARAGVLPIDWGDTRIDVRPDAEPR